MTKEETLEMTRKVLSEKNWSTLAKEYVLDAFGFIYDNYNPPRYIKTSLDDYIRRYLDILRKTKVLKVLSIDDLNLSTDEATYFRERIEVAKDNMGNLDIINGVIVPSTLGQYDCLLSGYADKKKQSVFLLTEEDRNYRSLNVLHELTHLEDGIKSFPLYSSIPYARLFRKMCIEGRAVFEEYMMNQDFFDACWGSTFGDDSGTFNIVSSKNPYPLFDILYKLLYFIIGPQTLDSLAKCNNRLGNIFDIIQDKYPDLPIYEIYAHIIYILAKEDDNSSLVIKNVINLYKREQYRNFSKKQAEYSSYIRAINEVYKKMMSSNLKEEFRDLQKIYLMLMKEALELKLKLKDFRKQTFTNTLMKVCVREESLEKSFQYLIDMAYQQINARYKINSNENEYLVYTACLEEVANILDFINNAKAEQRQN